MALDDWWLDRMMRGYVRQNNLTPTNKDKISVLTPTAVGTVGGINDPNAAKRMSVIVNFGDTDGNYRGSRITTYFTMRIKQLFKNVTPTVKLYNPQTMQEIGEALIKKYGLPLKVDAFSTVAVDATVLPANIQVGVGSWNWLEPDMLTVRVERASVSIPELITDSVLESPGLPTTIMSGRTPAEYTYPLDFTPDLPEQFDAVRNYPVIAFDDTNKESLLQDPAVMWLMDAISKRMGVPSDWEVTNPDGFPLYKSLLIYNGPTADYVPANAQPWSPRGDTQFDNLLVIQFSTDIPGRSGLGFFHYNSLGRY